MMLIFSRCFSIWSKKLDVSVTPVVDSNSKYQRLFSGLEISRGGKKLYFAK